MLQYQNQNVKGLSEILANIKILPGLIKSIFLNWYELCKAISEDTQFNLQQDDFFFSFSCLFAF